MLVLTIFAALTFFCANSTSAQQPQTVPAVDFTVEVIGSTVADFTVKMDAYTTLRHSLEEGLPRLVVTNDVAATQRAERMLAERIRRARAGANRGDIFTENIRHAFRQLLRPVTNEGTCEAIRDDNPGEFQYPLNSDYPKGKPLSTVPPSMLAVLPRLPEDVWYRFLDTDLILHDSRANVILDRIDNAIHCER